MEPAVKRRAVALTARPKWPSSQMYAYIEELESMPPALIVRNEAFEKMCDEIVGASHHLSFDDLHEPLQVRMVVADNPDGEWDEQLVILRRLEDNLGPKPATAGAGAAATKGKGPADNAKPSADKPGWYVQRLVDGAVGGPFPEPQLEGLRTVISDVGFSFDLTSALGDLLLTKYADLSALKRQGILVSASAMLSWARTLAMVVTESEPPLDGQWKTDRLVQRILECHTAETFIEQHYTSCDDDVALLLGRVALRIIKMTTTTDACIVASGWLERHLCLTKSNNNRTALIYIEIKMWKELNRDGARSANYLAMQSALYALIVAFEWFANGGPGALSAFCEEGTAPRQLSIMTRSDGGASPSDARRGGAPAPPRPPQPMVVARRQPQRSSSSSKPRAIASKSSES